MRGGDCGVILSLTSKAASGRFDIQETVQVSAGKKRSQWNGSGWGGIGWLYGDGLKEHIDIRSYGLGRVGGSDDERWDGDGGVAGLMQGSTSVHRSSPRSLGSDWPPRSPHGHASCTSTEALHTNRRPTGPSSGLAFICDTPVSA